MPSPVSSTPTSASLEAATTGGYAQQLPSADQALSVGEFQGRVFATGHGEGAKSLIDGRNQASMALVASQLERSGASQGGYVWVDHLDIFDQQGRPSDAQQIGQIDDDDEFFDCEEAPNESGGEGFEQSDHTQEVRSSKAGAVAGSLGSVELGAGEKSAQLRQEVEEQEKAVASGLFSWMAKVAGNFIQTVTDSAIERYHLDYGLHDAEESVAHEAAQQATKPPAVAPQARMKLGDSVVHLTAAQEAKSSIAKLEQQVATKVYGLIRHLDGLSNPELTKHLDSELHRANLGGLRAFRKPGALATSTMASPEVQATWLNSIKGFGEAAKKSSVRFGVALGLPSAASFLATLTGGVVGFGIQGAACCAATYLAIDTASKFPELTKDETFKSLADGAMSDLVNLGEQLERLKNQESLRQAFENRVELVTTERQQLIQGLTLEIGAIERVLSGADKRPAVGTGELRREVLSGASAAKSAFQSFFASIASSIGKGVMYLPNLVYDFVARRGAARAEQSYAQRYESQLGFLATRNDATQADRKQDAADAMEKAGYSESQQKSHFLTVERQLYMGENLAGILRNSDEVALGYVKVSSSAIPASLSLARALAWFVSVEAESASPRHQDGSLTVADRNGQLYNFLMSVPSAYTASMVGLENDQKRHASLTITDHGIGFPEGARSMQFERSLNPETGERELRVKFLKKAPAQIFEPLKNELQTSRNIFVEIFLARNRAKTGDMGDYSGQSPEDLEIRVTDLKMELATQKKLEQADLQQAKELQNWVQPDFMRGAMPKVGV